MNNWDVSVTEPWKEELIAHPSLGPFRTALPNLEGVRIPCPSQMCLFALGCGGSDGGSERQSSSFFSFLAC